MSVRKTIFDSVNERELFAAIDSHWSQRGFDLSPSLPFANIFDITKLDISPEEKTFLFKTSVDYTLCTKDGQPLVSVEFDGICHGFSRHGQYVAVRPAPRNDPRRHWKLDLKVRLATAADYPLLVVSYHEKNAISKDIHLTIVDGAIGQVLAGRDFRQQLNQHVSEVEDQLADMIPSVAREYLQDAVLSYEVGSDLEWNPIARAAAVADTELFDARISTGFSTQYLDPPGVPPVGLWPDIVQFEARLEALNRAIWVGCRVTRDTRLGPVSAEAWVRNIEHAGVHPLGLSEEIAKVLAAGRARELFASEQSSRG